MSSYQKYPVSHVDGHDGELLAGYEAITACFLAEYAEAGKKEEGLSEDRTPEENLSSENRGKKDFLIAVDTYPGVNDEEVIAALKRLPCGRFFDMRSVFYSEEELNKRLQFFLTDDRVFGRMFYGEIGDLMDAGRLAELRAAVEKAQGLCIVYGFGAFFACGETPCLRVYLDLSRWEIQLRYRRGMPNYNCTNSGEDIVRKFKRGYFVEWRAADQHKMRWLSRVDYFIDTNREGDPAMVPGRAVRDGLRQLTGRPFRTVPYFDPGVWGGQWMKEVCGLDRTKLNYAWSFDGVPEENSLLLDFGNGVFELPAMDLVLLYPEKLLGRKVYAGFGAKFPIRFDFLDTVGGQNLSLQVHPVTDYIHRQFGMAYTQDESYYILDAKEGACVYLGLKEDADPDEMFADLARANCGKGCIDVENMSIASPRKSMIIS